MGANSAPAAIMEAIERLSAASAISISGVASCNMDIAVFSTSPPSGASKTWP